MFILNDMMRWKPHLTWPKILCGCVFSAPVLLVTEIIIQIFYAALFLYTRALFLYEQENIMM